MKVFIAGPRAVKDLNANIINKLTNCIEEKHEFLIGDANGIDKAIQQYLSDNKYPDVTIYASNGIARNNIGNWIVKNVEVDKTVKGFDFYVQKDLQMVNDADCGFMIWNGQSKGTLNNMINLLHSNKQIILYLTKSNKFYSIKSFDTIDALVVACGEETEKTYRSLLKNNKLKTYQMEQLSFNI